ncbi:6-phospho-alpha-glucosidase [Clostridium beijerinckii]|jgi:alpha-galactosidase/6-phospho-beta-glucosidase family protein|uniref:6-phospho-alpha-glucosidase n=3 Tax=Clostridium beijerinckii TaxID=1520 RepID=A0AAE2RQI0_CLOBE|nr:6-phospho-alpha-glucosidase [Clostridium beijerinckii]ABR37084.1 glycoside hydrolase, family 4 [Clostridium beijerinckii NCIMB 8052]AIU02399.1 glycoside hydrolase family protein [Clostridium beijerinckii ATCC 35702]MBF7808267.1 6-phospho-alpha-glucosidase [Clostridium beijerinckii]MCI1478595.1 6-phospho-alpha-glucosidase [Clostridium beijerinckii]MCI1579575.1 6-phospho-alpha-glucosidase [Clostridium beijerinckii]
MKKYSICIVGGGSRYTPDMLAMLCNQKDRFPLRKIILYDNESERQSIVGKYAEILFKEYYPELEEIIYTTDEKEAFKDIDFALMQIRAGRLKMREKDEKISLKHGCLGQETCGPGGFAYGLRSVPAVIDIIKNIRTYSPECWILNYSNPAAIVAEATKRVFPSDHRIINICDMPIAIMDIYASVLGLKRKDLEPKYFGLNHFGWFTNILDKKTGEDYLPKLREILKTPVDVQTEPLFKEPSWKATFDFMSQMINDYDEYLPNTYLQYYLYPNKMRDKENPKYTRANEVMDGNEKETYERLREIISLGTMHGTKYEITSDVGCHAEYIVDLATAIANNTNEIFLIITENNGAIQNVSSGMMVEVPCRVGSNGVEPLAVGSVPTFYKGLMENQYAYEKLSVDACLEGSYQKALQALVLNRTVVNTNIAKELLKDLMDANKGYWNELH